MPKFEADIVCSSCDGTGLYQGMAEKKGCAVVCHTCKGTGCHKYSFTYTPFKKRKIAKGVRRVFAHSAGYGHAADDVTTSEGKLIEFSKGGATYEDWLAGAEPKPVKDLYCPYLWTNQGLQNKDKNDLYKDRCECGTNIGGYISECKFWKEKGKCWKQFEGE